MKEFVVGFSFKMALSLESQVVERTIVEQNVKPTILTKAQWAQQQQNEKNKKITWHMFVKGEEPCQSEQVTYPTYKQY